VAHGRNAARARLARRSARRKPWGYLPRHPGDLVQIDTTPITLSPGCQRVHMTARDVVSRKDVVAADKTGNSAAAEYFLRHVHTVREEVFQGALGLRGEVTPEGGGSLTSCQRSATVNSVRALVLAIGCIPPFLGGSSLGQGYALSFGSPPKVHRVPYATRQYSPLTSKTPAI
jgi:hypothetical protein